MQIESLTHDGRTPPSPEARLLRGIGFKAVRDDAGNIWFRELPETERTPARTLLDMRWTPDGPTIRERLDHVGRGTRAAA